MFFLLKVWSCRIIGKDELANQWPFFLIFSVLRWSQFQESHLLGVNLITCLCFLMYILVGNAKIACLSGLDAFCVSNKEVTLCQ